MTQEEIIEGNRLIAEFDGWESNRFENLPNKVHKIINGKLVGIALDKLNYHEDWNLVIPVIHEFLSLFPPQFNDKKSFLMVRTSLVNIPIHKDIFDFYNELIAAIKWYNQNKNKND